jgi:8-amino-7-oxononanoate synthase
MHRDLDHLTPGSPHTGRHSVDQIGSQRDGSVSHAGSIIGLLQQHAEAKPDEAVFTFLRDQDRQQVTFRELERRAAGVASALGAVCQPGDRAALLFPYGPDFIASFLGCLGAGVVAVPLYPPSRSSRSLDTTAAAIRDCGATVVLTTSSAVDPLRERFHGIDLGGRIRWLCSDEASPIGTAFVPPPADDAVAFLQYTSGSTGTPKGVMVSHLNLLTNVDMLASASGFDQASVGVSWLPPYHDMGLIGGLLTPIAVGFHTALMAPTSFLQRPIRWLHAITEFGATGTGGPNFGYELCVSKISDDDARDLSLGTLQVAYNGAEPISADTLDRFATKFAPHGFNRSAFFPCYGLAEATLFVAGTGHGNGFSVLDPKSAGDARAADGGEAGLHCLVSCGQSFGETEIRIVEPDTGRTLSEKQTGEIWVKGPSVAAGYWRNPEASAETFNATLTDEGTTGWLRTGDLGFVQDTRLYVSGREKDLLIIRGRNYYPQDIEWTVQASHESLQPNAVAAFSVQIDGEERLIVAAELQRSALKSIDPDAVFAAIRRSISENHELQAFSIILLKSGGLPKTTSGKVRRRQCKAEFSGESWPTYAAWRLGDASNMRQSDPHPVMGSSNSSSLHVIREWLLANAADALGIAAGDLDLNKSLRDYGLDSFQAATISGEFSEQFGFAVEPEIFDRFDDLESVSEHLAAKFDTRKLLQSMSSSDRDKFIDEIITESKDGDLFEGQDIQKEYYILDEMLEVKAFSERAKLLTSLPFNPFFSVHEGTDNEFTEINGRKLINFSSNNFLSLSGHPEVTAAAISALNTYGSSVSGSRLIAGERPLHKELEQNIARWLGVDDAVAFVAANMANLSTVGDLYGPGDLILYDELSHNSLLQGVKLSHADAMPFKHNDVSELRRLLKLKRRRYRKVLVFIEGLYSMDGDIPDLPAFIEAKSEFKAHLMVDECLSIGVMGETGRGIGEHFGTRSSDVDIWMGGISKAFASCGGYIAGSAEFIRYLRYSSPGFIYTTGLSPANTASALKAMKILEEDSSILDRLRENTKCFIDLALKADMDIGACKGEAPIVPVIIGDQMRCLAVHQRLHERGINVTPIFYPAVSENSARLRFSLSPTHSFKELEFTIDQLRDCLGS